MGRQPETYRDVAGRHEEYRKKKENWETRRKVFAPASSYIRFCQLSRQLECIRHIRNVKTGGFVSANVA